MYENLVRTLGSLRLTAGLAGIRIAPSLGNYKVTGSRPLSRAHLPLFWVADHPFPTSLNRQNEKLPSPHRPRPFLNDGMYRGARTLRPIFSIAAALFGLLASAAGSGVIAPVSPTSFIPGKAFDRFVIIWLENTVILPVVRGIFTEKYNRITTLLCRTAIFKCWHKKALSSNDITVTTPIFLSSQGLSPSLQH